MHVHRLVALVANIVVKQVVGQLAMVLAEAQLQLLQTQYLKPNVIVVNMNVISIKTIQLKVTNKIWKEN